MKELQTATDFHEFFSAIPEDKWCINAQHNRMGQHCTLGHLDPDQRCRPMGHGHDTKEGMRLLFILTGLTDWRGDLGPNAPHHINNGSNSNYQQSTPKQRILAALGDIIEKEQQDIAVSATNEIINTPVEELELV